MRGLSTVLRGIGTGLLLACGLAAGAQQQCAQRLTFTPVSQPNRIEWSKFPDFSLAFPVVYCGPRLGDTQASPLRHGFSHLNQVAPAEFGTLVQPRQWAPIYYGFATGLNQPWETLQSPFGNDLTAYQRKWDAWLRDLSGGRTNAAGQYVLPVGRLLLDIERILETDTQILRLKANPSVPVAYRNLPDAQFLVAYKRAIRNLYAEGVRYVRQRADLTGITLGSYADTPILNTYFNIPTFSWADWTTNLGRVNYLVKDSTEVRVGGPYYDQLDELSPSAYFDYDYPNPLAPDYLAYLLFQIEVNRAWSAKPVVPFVSVRYASSSSTFPAFIQPTMAEALAIFPVFSGAGGLWLWDDPTLETTRTTDILAAYEHFTHGLYRLSQFNDMLQGSEPVIDAPARDLLAGKQPVWRGLVKGNNILIVAQNPYATEGQKTSLTVRYKDWQQVIELTGREVYLCRFDRSLVTATEPVLGVVTVSPNPARTQLTVLLSQPPRAGTELTLTDATGRILSRLAVNSQQTSLSVAGWPAGVYVVRISQGRDSQTSRVLLTR